MSQRLPITWGTEMIGAGGARFRLWAPAQSEIGLVAHGPGEILAMEPDDDGWFMIETDLVKPGGGYSFVLSDNLKVPDPAARAQLGDVNGPSRLVDPDSYEWRLPYWKGRPWHEAAIYELHTGTFSVPGNSLNVCRPCASLNHSMVTVTRLSTFPWESPRNSLVRMLQWRLQPSSCEELVRSIIVQ